MAKLQITLTRGISNSLKKHQLTVQALGLKKIGQMVEQEDNAAIRGMIQKVRHLVKVEEI